MATPKKLPNDGHSPVKYDTDIQALVEKTTKETFQGLDQSEGTGACDMKDTDCMDGFSKDMKPKKVEKVEEEPAKELSQSDTQRGVKIDPAMHDEKQKGTGIPVLDSVAISE